MNTSYCEAFSWALAVQHAQYSIRNVTWLAESSRDARFMCMRFPGIGDHHQEQVCPLRIDRNWDSALQFCRLRLQELLV